jgi:hypothetical protein
MWYVGGLEITLAILNYLRDKFGNDSVQETTATVARRLHVYWSRTGTTPAADDRLMISLDFLKVDDGAPSDDWVAADFEAIESAVDTWWAAVKNLHSSAYKLDEYRWYRKTPGVSEVGPARRVVDRDVAGTSSAHVHAPQSAVSVTERTALRKHWGRFYLPIGNITLTANGRIPVATAQSIADLWKTVLQAGHARGIYAVTVADRLKAALLVQEVQVDDVVDVIRSRRYRAPTVRERRDLEPA